MVTGMGLACYGGIASPRIDSMTVPQNDPGFLNVPALLEASEPRQRMAWMRLGMGGFVMAVLLSWFFGRNSADRQGLSILLSVGLTFFLGRVAAGAGGSGDDRGTDSTETVAAIGAGGAGVFIQAGAVDGGAGAGGFVHGD